MAYFNVKGKTVDVNNLAVSGADVEVYLATIQFSGGVGSSVILNLSASTDSNGHFSVGFQLPLGSNIYGVWGAASAAGMDWSGTAASGPYGTGWTNGYVVDEGEITMRPPP